MFLFAVIFRLVLKTLLVSLSTILKSSGVIIMNLRKIYLICLIALLPAAAVAKDLPKEKESSTEVLLCLGNVCISQSVGTGTNGPGSGDPDV